MRFPYVVLLSSCVLMWAATLLAQSPNGVINGLVVDQSNKAIAGADLLVINDATGVKYSGKTNEDGIYVMPNLPPGPYRLQVSKVGFKTLIKPDIVLNIQDALSINFTLPVGAVFEIVTVEGGASMINTTDASVSTVVDQSYVKNMPLNGRSFQDLILLTPGVVTQTPQASSLGGTGVGLTGEFSVNGQRTESNYYTVDGVSANVGTSAGAPAGVSMFAGAGPSGSLGASTALGTTQALVSVDDLQEFRVQSSTYSAVYGRNPGGQIAFETKSGTNQWHGTTYDYLRNNAFDASDWFSNYFQKPATALRQNDFGGTFGGPLEVPGLYNGRDRTFFFVSYEGLRLIQPQAATANFVPDLCMRGRGACPTSGPGAGRMPAPSAVLPLIDAFPLPSPNGLEDAVNGFGQFIGNWSNPSSLDSTSVRLDHVVNKKLRVFFRFSDTGSYSAIRRPSPNYAPSLDQISSYSLRTYTAGVNTILANRLSNEFRLNYSSNATTQSQVIDPFGGSASVNLAQLSNLSAGTAFSVGFVYGGYEILLEPYRQSGAQNQWNLVDTVSLSLGRHQLKFGADYRRLAPFVIPATSIGAFYYLSETSVEANDAVTLGQARAPGHPLYANFSAFAQDEWRLSRGLSLSLGLRWEVNPAPGVTQGLKPYTFQGSGPNTWTLAPQGTPLWRTTWYNFAPRLGVAYTIRKDPGWETVVRAGTGIFFDSGQQLGSLGFQGPGFVAETGFVLGAFPVFQAGIPSIVNPPTSPYAAVPYGFAPHLQLPYTFQWNTSLEQAIGKSQALTISYVGSHASRLLQQNQFSSSVNPDALPFLFIQNGLSSDYDSLQVQFQRRLTGGLTALASYTWSRCTDYGSENYSLGYQHGNCDFDVRHNFSGAFSYDLPNGGSKGFVNDILHHWGIDDRFVARTAFPVTLYGEGLLQTNGQFYDSGLNLVQNQPIYLYGANCATVLQGLGDLASGQGCPGRRAINPNAFTLATSGIGDAPRNFARGLGAWQMDLAVRRDFPIHERLKLQIRAETFNVFNHPNFGQVSGNFGTSNFGQFTSTLANSLGVLSPLYQMGGPRSIQFALKLVF